MTQLRLWQILRERSAETWFQWVKGHSRLQGNDKADKLAGQRARLPEERELEYGIKGKFDITGAQLLEISQATAYWGIGEWKTKEESRKGTDTVLDMTRYAVRDAFGSFPEESKIWSAVWNKEISTSIQSFLYKALHRAHKVGKFWQHCGEEFKHLVICPKCRVEETMNHILTECNVKGQELIWN